MLAGIVIIFAVSWLPLGSFSLLADLVTSEMMMHGSPQNLYTALAVVHGIAMSSAISNPIVYGWLNSNIRHEFLQLLPARCTACCAKSQDADVAIGATAVENDTTKTHILYHGVENDVNSKRESMALLVTLNKNSHASPTQISAHL